MVDITQHKQTDQELRQSEEKYRTLVEQSLAGIVIAQGPPPKLAFVNEYFADMLGYTVSDMLAMSPQEIYELVHPDDRDMFFGRFAARIAGKQVPDRYEFRSINRDKRTIWLEISSALIHYLGKPAVQAVFNDITRRKEAENQLMESYKDKEEAVALLNALFDSAPLGVCFFDEELRYVRLNQALADMNGLPIEEHLGRRVDEVLPGLGNGNEIVSSWQRIIKTGESMTNVEVTGEVPGRPGEIQTWLENWYPVVVKGKTIGIAATVMDITDRRRMEEELRRARNELEIRVQERTGELSRTNKELETEIEKRERFEQALRESGKKIISEARRRRFLSGRLVETLERDRREVAMYLHDQVGQMLASLRMELEEARKEAFEKDGSAGEKLRESEDKVQSILHHVKDVSRKLRPDILDNLGLVPALRSLTKSYKEENSLAVHFYYREPVPTIDPDKALAIYRITQEALTNAVKHAGAQQVFVNLISKDDSIRLSVEDDGIGFNYSELLESDTGEGPLGIMIMRERAVLAGGELFVESQMGKGTHVIAEIPL